MVVVFLIGEVLVTGFFTGAVVEVVVVVVFLTVVAGFLAAAVDD